MSKQIFIWIFFATQLLFASSSSLLEKKGAKIASIMCDKKALKARHFEDIAEAEKAIISEKLCQKLNKQQLLAVATYLADSKKSTSIPAKINVPKDAKCPICGMFVAKYPKWVTLMQDNQHHKFYFDGVKDMMKYYFNHPKITFAPILVHDFYTLKPIDAKTAFYVIGSNVYGPMGEELIPFTNEEDAKIFLHEHKGKKIIKFDEITEDYLY